MTDDKQSAIDGWKEWHRQIREIVGVKVNERMVTLQAIKHLVGEIARLRADLAASTLCDCGRKLSRGQCGICDNDD